MQRTGIPVNFGITVLLGFIIGAAIAGQTFYLFTIDNLKQFGALKAMGVSNGGIVGMVLVQGLVVGVLGYAIGFGLAAVAEEIMACAHQGRAAGGVHGLADSRRHGRRRRPDRRRRRRW